MTCPRSGRALSGPPCEPRNQDANSAACVAHLSQGRGAETGGVRERRDAFGMTPAPGCRGPEAGADPGDLWVGVVHSSHAHAGSEGRDPLTEPRPPTSPAHAPAQECTCADFPLGDCAGDARHLLANVCIPGASRPCDLPWSGCADQGMGLPVMPGRGGGRAPCTSGCGSAQRKRCSGQRRGGSGGPWGLWLLGPRGLAGPVRASGVGGGAPLDLIRGTWWSPVLHGCARPPPTPGSSL